MHKVLITAEENIDTAFGSQCFVVAKQYSQNRINKDALFFAPLDARAVYDYADFADELLLTDGPPIHKAWAGGIYTQSNEMFSLSVSRDELEFALVKAFQENSKPIAGVGRGEAIINTAAATSYIPMPVKTSKKKPTILIAGGPAYDRLHESPSVMINKTYPNAIAAAGGISLLALGDIAQADAYADASDALILTGTAMFAPKQELHKRLLAEEDSIRNAFDETIYRAFCKREKPVLGICLGHQVINRFEGGTILQNFKLTDGVEHMLHAHTVTAQQGSVIHSLFGESLIVNSRHNDRIGVLADSLLATAYSADGVIEAIQHRTLPVYAVQWHPERQRGDMPEPANAPDMSLLFEWFVAKITDEEICL